MTLRAVTPRLATEADVPALVRLINRAYAPEKAFVDGDRTNEAMIRERLARPSAVFLVVDDGAAPQELAAAVFVELRAERGYFGMLAVDPRRQGSGLGRLLVHAAAERCRAAGCQFLDIDVVNLRTELRAFYARFGFAPYATAPFESAAPLKRHAFVVRLTKPLVPLW